MCSFVEMDKTSTLKVWENCWNTCQWGIQISHSLLLASVYQPTMMTSEIQEELTSYVHTQTKYWRVSSLLTNHLHLASLNEFHISILNKVALYLHGTEPSILMNGWYGKQYTGLLYLSKIMLLLYLRASRSGFHVWLVMLRLWVRDPSNTPVVSLSKKLYPCCLVLVGSRNGFERDFTIELK